MSGWQDSWQLVRRRSCRVTVFCIDFVCPAEASTSEPSLPPSATVGSARFETISKTVPFRSLDRTSISKIDYLILIKNCVKKLIYENKFVLIIVLEINWIEHKIYYNFKLYEVELSAFKLRRRFGSVFKTKIRVKTRKELININIKK